MGAKGSKSYSHSYGINVGEYANDFIGYRQVNPAYHMQARVPPQIPQINAVNQQKSSPVQSSSQLGTNQEANDFEKDKSKFNTVNGRRKPASPEIIPYKTQKVSKSSLLQELLECPICMNLYDTPTVLPCQHTFCKRCIASLNSNDTPGNLPITIVCPICRESHLLPNGIDTLTSNYTMKRLIELESMVPEKEKKKEKPKENAKCFVCQKYCQLKVCSDCSYMLCKECIQDPNHDIIIESKLHSKKSHSDSNKFTSMIKSDTRFNKQLYSEKYDMYADPKIMVDEKFKLILLCHSASVELKNESENSENSDSCSRQPEIYEDEFGKCATYSKLSISVNERLITLKKIVEKKFGISLEDQIIVYKDRILKNDLKTLASFQLRQYSKVHIFDERDLKENFNEDEEIYGTYTNLSSPKIIQAANAEKSKEKTAKSVSPSINRDLYSSVSPKKLYANTEEKAPSRGIRKDRSIYKTRRPSKIIYENDPNISNYTTIRKQNKYYSSAASFSKYANSNHYANY